MTNPSDIVGLNDLNEIARRLRALTRRYEDFFKLQYQRLDKHMTVQKELIGQSDVIRRMMDDFEQQKKDWEQQREAELERISQAGDKLMNAWTELENQQRKLLADSNGRNLETPPSEPVTQPLPAAIQPLQPRPGENGFGNLNEPQINETTSSTTNPTPVVRETAAATVAENPLPPPRSTQGGLNYGNRDPVPVRASGAAAPPKPSRKKVNSENSAQFEYEQLKRQMLQHANRQG